MRATRFRIRGLRALAAVVALAALPSAAASADELASFGPTGTGPGRISPHAPGIAVAPGGEVYVADLKDNRVEAFANDGTANGGWTESGPQAVAVEADGNVVTADPTGVHRFAPDGGPLGLLAAVGPGGLASPRGIAAAPDGTVWVADAGRGEVDAIAGPRAGTRYFGFTSPVGVAVAGDGTVFVADAGAGAVRSILPDGDVGPRWTVSGVAGIATAPDGSVLAVDSIGDDVLRFTAEGTALGRVEGHYEVPLGVATDCRGRVYVVDNAALRIHVFGDPGSSPPPCPVAPPPPPPPPPVVVQVPDDPGPILGVRGRATLISGTVRVGRNGALHALSRRELVPVGDTIDASDGQVMLEFQTTGADVATYGPIESGEFTGGSFTIGQTKTDSLVELDLAADTVAASGARLRAHASAKRKRLRVIGHAHGRFRTVGRNGAATVMGTRWLTEEQSRGTYFGVTEGVVRVKDFTTGKTIILRAGQHYLARPACYSKRNFKIHLRAPLGTRIVRAVVTVRGKRIAVRRGNVATIDLRGVPKGTVVVHITVKTSSGLRIRGTRVYHTCVAPRPPHAPPQL